MTPVYSCFIIVLFFFTAVCHWYPRTKLCIPFHGCMLCCGQPCSSSEASLCAFYPRVKVGVCSLQSDLLLKTGSAGGEDSVHFSECLLWWWPCTCYLGWALFHLESRRSGVRFVLVPWDFWGKVELYQWLEKLALQWLPCHRADSSLIYTSMLSNQQTTPTGPCVLYYFILNGPFKPW